MARTTSIVPIQSPKVDATVVHVRLTPGRNRTRSGQMTRNESKLD